MITRRSPTPKNVLAQRCIDFIYKIKQVKKKHSIQSAKNIWCIDELCITEGLNNYITTWDFKSSKDTYARNVRNQKIAHTLTLMCNGDGSEKSVFYSKNQMKQIQKHQKTNSTHGKQLMECWYIIYHINHG